MGQDNGIELIGGDLAHARIHVAAQGANIEVGAQRAELRNAPGRAGTYLGPLGQLVKGEAVAGDERLARGLADRVDGSEALGLTGGKVLAGVDGNIDLAAVHSLAQRLGEHAHADLLHRGQVAVARGGDDLQFCVVACANEGVSNMARLRGGKLGTACTDAKCHLFSFIALFMVALVGSLAACVDTDGGWRPNSCCSALS